MRYLCDLLSSARAAFNSQDRTAVSETWAASRLSMAVACSRGVQPVCRPPMTAA